MTDNKTTENMKQLLLNNARDQLGDEIKKLQTELTMMLLVELEHFESAHKVVVENYERALATRQKCIDEVNEIDSFTELSGFLKSSKERVDNLSSRTTFSRQIV